LSAASQHIGAISKLEVWKIDNPDLNYKFERKSSGMMRLQSLVSTENMSSENSVEAICSRGYYLGLGQSAGALFTTGLINLPNKDATFASDIQFVLFDIAVGRSFAFDGSLVSATIPPGYDSLYIPDQPLDRNRDGKFSLQEYQNAASFDNRDPSKYAHRYYIKDPNQVMPKYILRFRLSRAKNVRLDDATLGATNPTDLRYIDPVTLKPAPEMASGNNGRNNGSTPITMGGNNNTTDNFDKRLMPIEKVFAQAVTDMNYLESDATTISKRQWMDKQLFVIEDKVREINLNYADIAEAIEDIAEQSKSNLQQLVRDKLELCLSMEIELRRQSEQLLWLQGAVAQELQRYQHALVDAHGNDALRRQLMLDFLKQWKQYLLLRNGILRTKPSELQAISGVHGDVKIQGDVKIFIDPFYQHNQLLAAQAIASGQQPGVPRDSTDATQQVEGSSDNQHPDGAKGKRDESDIADLIQRLNTEASSNSATTSHSYVVPAIQRVVNQEMESIQSLLAQQMQNQPVKNVTSKQGKQQSQQQARSVLVNSSALQLPRTILKATAMGAGGRHQPLALHSILDLLKEEADKPLPLTSTAEEKLGVVGEESAEDKELKDEFMSQALPAALGYDASSAVPKKAVAGAPQSMAPIVSSAASVHSISSSPHPVDAGSKHVTEKKKPDETEKQQSQTLSKLPVASDQIEMTLIQLQQFVRQYPAFSLSTQSMKKQKQLQVRYASGIASESDSYKHFLQSRIILPTEIETVFFSLPIFAQPPKVKCIYSSHDHRRSMEELLSRTVKNRYPTLVVIQSGDFRFGAFLSHPPLPTCSWSGNPSCFLFSLTLDLKIPFHARHVLGDTLASSDPCAMFVQPDRIFLGNGDLTIDGGLDRGTSELENCYGMGMEEHSVEAMCLLAGAPFFSIDALEVWCLQTN
jgi:hypothetical protein